MITSFKVHAKVARSTESVTIYEGAVWKYLSINGDQVSFDGEAYGKDIGVELEGYVIQWTVANEPDGTEPSANEMIDYLHRSYEKYKEQNVHSSGT